MGGGAEETQSAAGTRGSIRVASVKLGEAQVPQVCGGAGYKLLQNRLLEGRRCYSDMRVPFNENGV